MHPSFRALSLEVLKSFLVALSRARDGTRDGFDFERRESLKETYLWFHSSLRPFLSTSLIKDGEISKRSVLFEERFQY